MLAWHSRRQIVSLYGWMAGWMERASPLNPPFLPLMFNFIKTPYNQTSLELCSLACDTKSRTYKTLRHDGASRRDKRLLRLPLFFKRTRWHLSTRRHVLYQIMFTCRQKQRSSLARNSYKYDKREEWGMLFWEEEGVFLRCCLAYPES